MKLNNVYVGFTKDGKDRCLQKTIRTFVTNLGDVTCTSYFDLENGVEIDNNLVDFNTLVPYRKKFNIDKKRMFRRKVVKTYQADRDKLIDAMGVFYGTITERDFWSKSRYYMENKLRENVLFTRMDDPECRVMDLHTSKIYPRRERTLRGTVVQEERDINYDQFDDVMQPKRKILEMDYRKEL